MKGKEKNEEKNKMKEYYVMSICAEAEDTENKINRFALKGWKLICSYAKGNWLILERDKETCKSCGK